MMSSQLPLSLYIHFPWCVKKCPYCDFNSHTIKGEIPEAQYIDVLLQHFIQLIPRAANRPIASIFMGGGTPSLFSASSLKKLLQGISDHHPLQPNLEITLEANPGTVEQSRFTQYRAIGINRLSLGVQSFNDHHLQQLGRIHDAQQAIKAIQAAKHAGFTEFNIDLMFGLPHQTLQQGLDDLKQAIELKPTHLSWYELTIEPNTAFWHQVPPLPPDETVFSLQQAGQALLTQAGFAQYEVSAYSRHQPCYHNLNYWQFGDYLAIGAGSHGKITDFEHQQIIRYQHFRHPKQYMEQKSSLEKQHVIPTQELPFEFMLNALRLKKGVMSHTFLKRTGLSLESIYPPLQLAHQKKWLQPFNETLCTTDLGYRFLNDVISLFLPSRG